MYMQGTKEKRPKYQANGKCLDFKCSTKCLFAFPNTIQCINMHDAHKLNSFCCALIYTKIQGRKLNVQHKQTTNYMPPLSLHNGINGFGGS